MGGVEKLAGRIRWAVAAGLALGCGPTVSLPDDGNGGADQGNDNDDDAASATSASNDDDDDDATPMTTSTPTTGDGGTSDNDDDDADDDDDDGPYFDLGGGSVPPKPSECFDDPPLKPTCDATLEQGQLLGYRCMPQQEKLSCDGILAEDVLTEAQQCLGCAGFAEAVACGPAPSGVDTCCHWIVYDPGQVCPGRPFTVEGESRIPGVEHRSDWRESIAVDIASLDEHTRETLAAAWADEGCYEAASVGSFARFVLELLALGAPPSLIADAQRAAAEEVGHARAFFGFAAAHGGRDVGPSELDVSGALAGSSDPILIAERLASEGCIAESISALQLEVAASRAADPAMRDRLLAIANEELQHAELAWRALGWMLQRGDDRMRQCVATVFARATDFVPRATSAADELPPSTLHRAGRLGFDERNALAERALESIVAPAVERLFERWSAPAQSWV